MRTVNAEKVAKQRQEIVYAAIRTFSRVGLAESSTDNICREAGISPGRLYYYFKSKNELLDEVIHYVYNFAPPKVEKFLLQSEYVDVVDALVRGHEAIDGHLADIGLSNPLLLEIICSSVRRPRLKRLLRARHKMAVKMVQDGLRRQQQAGMLRLNVDTGELAELLLLVLTGTRTSILLTDKFKDQSLLRQTLESIVLPYRALPSIRTGVVETKKRSTA